jgi:hypothetical protein
MKNLLKYSGLFLLFLFSALGCDLEDKNDAGNGTVTDYANLLVDLSATNEDFVLVTHQLLSENFDDLTITEINRLFDKFITAGEVFVSNLETVEKYQQNSTGNYDVKSATAVCTPYDVVPTLDNGVGVGLTKSVGDLIAETQGDVNKLQKMLDNKEIDENQYKDATDELRKKKLLKAAGLTIGSIAGTGAAIVTGAVVGTATLPAIATIAVVGGVVGGTVTWFSNWYSGANKSASGEESTMMFISGTTTNGGTIPLNYLKEGASLTIIPEGMAPITISNLKLPVSGMNRTYEFAPNDLGSASKEEGYEVCYFDEPMVAATCNEIMFVTAYPSPANPSPGQDVTVYATTVPPVSNCNVNFTIVGTDGYSDSEDVLTNAQGMASFGIPGAEDETVDKVTITTSNGKTYSITYVF